MFIYLVCKVLAVKRQWSVCCCVNKTWNEGMVSWMRNATHRLDMWSLVGGSCPREAVMEEMCHWGQVLRIHNLTLLLIWALCFRFVVESADSQFPVPATVWRQRSSPSQISIKETEIGEQQERCITWFSSQKTGNGGNWKPYDLCSL